MGLKLDLSVFAAVNVLCSTLLGFSCTPPLLIPALPQPAVSSQIKI